MIKPSNRASIRNISDYSPFGVQLSERTISGDGYRFGFQGQEGDDEIKGEGNSVNYKFRMHDPRLGRFFAVDPLAPEYPHNSPYAFSENVVINAVELVGLEKAEPPYLAGSNKPNPNAGKAIPEPTPMLTGGPGLMPTKNALLMPAEKKESSSNIPNSTKTKTTGTTSGSTLKVQTTVGEYSAGKVSLETSETNTVNEGKGLLTTTIDGITAAPRSFALSTSLGTMTLSKSGEFTYGGSHWGVGSNAAGGVVLNLKIPTGWNSTYNTKITLNLSDWKSVFDNVIKELVTQNNNVIMPLTRSLVPF